ncbi:MAG: hypothetical protein WA417_19860, partial [Stellaceae bacterium]
LQLVERGLLRKTRDHVVEIAMLGFQDGELCRQRFDVDIHGGWWLMPTGLYQLKPDPSPTYCNKK